MNYRPGFMAIRHIPWFWTILKPYSNHTVSSTMAHHEINSRSSWDNSIYKSGMIPIIHVVWNKCATWNTYVTYIVYIKMVYISKHIALQSVLKISDRFHATWKISKTGFFCIWNKRIRLKRWRWWFCFIFRRHVAATTL